MAITIPTITGSTASASGTVAERKLLMTVVEWGTDNDREVLGLRTEDSSIELNPDTETTTDIYGNTYTEINKTEPQQDIDQPIISGSAFADYIISAMLEKQGVSGTGGTGGTSGYYAVKHQNCSIIPSNVGGSTKLNSSLEVHFSNDLTVGWVDKDENNKVDIDDFVFTATTSSGNL